MVKKILMMTAFVLASMAAYAADSSAPATELPDISLIGNFTGGISNSGRTDFKVDEVELGFQHYLYPSVKADVFLSLKKNERHQTEIDVEEAYVTFADFFGVVTPDLFSDFGLGVIVGKKHLGIGKENPLHPEQKPYVDRPLSNQTLLGGDEALAGEGVQVSSLLPLSFFSQLELGIWKVDVGQSFISSRLWNSLPLSDSQELEVGVSQLSKVGSSSQNGLESLTGVDLSYQLELNKGQNLKTVIEAYRANVKPSSDELAYSQFAAYANEVWTINKYWQTGLRLDYLGGPGDSGDSTRQIALYLTRNLTETTKFRIQLNQLWTGDTSSHTVLFQFIFGMGPHSHVLQ